MPIGVADADAIAIAEEIVTHAKSSSSMGTCIIDCINLLFIVLCSVEANGTALAHHSACQYMRPLLMPLPKELSHVPKAQVLWVHV
jgi:hypothetical protein